MMFSAARRRILDGLNRRYIYGRFVCVQSLLHLPLPSLWPFSGSPATGLFRSHFEDLMKTNH
ncbi:hypothetical protein BDV59DRAFT_176491 [Aspergillus ambiguus]|uniref:uncharacterized protein n=1 Tax=Aspergillus ambiguus TaxID=176160 RepID=UPI003CCD33F1